MDIVSPSKVIARGPIPLPGGPASSWRWRLSRWIIPDPHQRCWQLVLMDAAVSYPQKRRVIHDPDKNEI
jgi:hypothetical protein